MVPPQRGPDDDGGDEHSEGVDLTLDGGEPGGVAEEVAEGADEGGDVGSECASVPFTLRVLGKSKEDGPVEEHHGEASGDGGEGVGAAGHEHGVAACEPGEGVGQ